MAEALRDVICFQPQTNSHAYVVEMPNQKSVSIAISPDGNAPTLSSSRNGSLAGTL